MLSLEHIFFPPFRGYTSLGTLDNTRPNCELKYVDASGRERYKPAYLLDDSATERKGRGGTCLPDCCGRPSRAIDLASVEMAEAATVAALRLAGSAVGAAAGGGGGGGGGGVGVGGAGGGKSRGVDGGGGGATVKTVDRERPLCGKGAQH